MRPAAQRLFSTASAPSKRIVVVDGCRIPFLATMTGYNDLMAYDLGKMAIKGLLTRTAIDPKVIDYVTFGTVVQECRTSNLARDSAMGAGVPATVAAHTISQACISANQAICSGAQMILAGQADVVIAGGAETFSDVPIRWSRPMRKKFLKLNKTKGGAIPMLKVLTKGLKMKDLVPEAPSIANFTTSEVMGNSSDRLASRFKISRADQDAYVVRSHKGAFNAHSTGLYKEEIIPVNGSSVENVVRSDLKLDGPKGLSSLKPVFIKPHGTHTAGNSSPLTDGAAACLIMSDVKAK